MRCRADSAQQQQAPAAAVCSMVGAAAGMPARILPTANLPNPTSMQGTDRSAGQLPCTAQSCTLHAALGKAERGNPQLQETSLASPFQSVTSLKWSEAKRKKKKSSKISWRGAAGQPGQHTWQPHAGFQRKFGKPAVGNLRRGPTWLRLPPGGPTYDRSDGPVVGWGRSSPRPRPAEALPPQTQLARLATAACFTSL